MINDDGFVVKGNQKMTVYGFLLVNTKPNTFFKELGDIQFPLLKSQQ